MPSKSVRVTFGARFALFLYAAAAAFIALPSVVAFAVGASDPRPYIFATCVLSLVVTPLVASRIDRPRRSTRERARRVASEWTDAAPHWSVVSAWPGPMADTVALAMQCLAYGGTTDGIVRAHATPGDAVAFGSLRGNTPRGVVALAHPGQRQPVHATVETSGQVAFVPEPPPRADIAAAVTEALQALPPKSRLVVSSQLLAIGTTDWLSPALADDLLARLHHLTNTLPKDPHQGPMS